MKLSKISAKFLYFFPIALVGLVGSFILHNTKLTYLEKFAQVGDGLQTCFSRVNQTFVANAIGSLNSSYMTPGFMVLTEQCLGEVNSITSEIREPVFSLIAKDINRLSNRTHSFHKSVETIKAPSEKIDKLFEQLEETYFSLNEGLQKERQLLKGQEQTQKLLFYISSIVLVVIGFIEFYRRFKLNKANNRYEKMARKEIEDKGVTASATIESIIKQALDNNELVACGQLFTRYHSDMLAGKIHAFMPIKEAIGDNEIQERSVASEVESTPDGNSEPSLQEEFGPIIKNEEIGRPKFVKSKVEIDPAAMGDDRVDVGKVLHKTIDTFSEELRSKGFIIEIEIDEELPIKGDRDAINQAIHSLISRAYQNSLSSLDGRRLAVKAKTLGSTIIIDIIDSSEGFSTEELYTPINVLSDQGKLDVDLAICYEMVKGLEGDIKLLNFDGEYHDQSGKQVQIILNRAETSKKKGKVGLKEKTIRILKGKKKDILNATSAN